MNRIGSFARMEYYETSGQIWNVKYTKTKARQTEQRLTATDLESKSESSRLWLCVDETARSIYTLLDLDL